MCLLVLYVCVFASRGCISPTNSLRVLLTVCFSQVLPSAVTGVLGPAFQTLPSYQEGSQKRCQARTRQPSPPSPPILPHHSSPPLSPPLPPLPLLSPPTLLPLCSPLSCPSLWGRGEGGKGGRKKRRTTGERSGTVTSEEKQHLCCLPEPPLRIQGINPAVIS